MKQMISRESLQRFYGKGIHLYAQGVECQGWFIVPFISGQFYTTSCFDPKGKRYISWSQYLSTEEAIAVDCLFVLRRVREIASVY
ncbi:MAG: hypothetical protein OHK0047_28100 [Leptolyngbyaceae cyanobacterium]